MNKKALGNNVLGEKKNSIKMRVKLKYGLRKKKGYILHFQNWSLSKLHFRLARLSFGISCNETTHLAIRKG